MELAAHSSISALTVFHISRKYLKMRKLCAKWVSHALGDVGNNMLNRITVIDETWAREYEPELKRQPNEWHCRG